jgi:hypothetical protein
VSEGILFGLRLASSASTVPPIQLPLAFKPCLSHQLAFPFVGRAISSRFNANPEDDWNWYYMGREKFEILLREFHAMQKSCDTTALWLYGTQGYGKSHILAAFVSYPCARGNERVTYIPDCRELLSNIIPYFQAAMLFAWSDDASMQREIIRTRGKNFSASSTTTTLYTSSTK